MFERTMSSKNLKKAELQRSKDAIALQLERQTPWSRRNSPLESWWYPLSYQKDFMHVLPQGERNLRKYIETVLAPQQGQALGLELGGLGSKLFSGFTPSFFQRTLAISLEDHRTKRLQKRDTVRNHSVIVGNILDKSTQTQAKESLEHKKFNLIIERMQNGLGLLPEEPFFMAQQASIWYELLAENGLLFAEVPYAFLPYIESWQNSLSSSEQTQLDIQLGKGSGKSMFLRMHKLPNAPETLPTLVAREIFRQAR